MDVIPLVACAIVDQPHTYNHWWFGIWRRCQHLYGWLELMVHHTPSKAEAKNVPVFFHPPMAHPCPWSVVWSVWIWSPYLVACANVDQYHTYTNWWIERGISTCIDNWNSCYSTHHWRLNVYQFQSIYPWHIIGVLCGHHGCDPLVRLLVQLCINLAHVHIEELIEVSTPAWVFLAHNKSHTIKGRG